MYLLQSQESPFTSQSDGQLAQQTLSGKELAFESLVKRYDSPLFHYIYHLLGDYDSSCDVLQRVMVQLYKSLPTLRWESSFKAWLFKVAHNQAIDDLRSRRCLHFSTMEGSDTEETELLTIADGAPLPQAVLEHHELQQHLKQAINALPAHYRAIVFLRYLSPLTFAEIGQIVCMPEATVKTYFQRAKPLLKQHLRAKHVYELLPQQ